MQVPIGGWLYHLIGRWIYFKAVLISLSHAHIVIPVHSRDGCIQATWPAWRHQDVCVHLHNEFEDEVWYHHVLIKCPGILLDCGDCMLALDVPFVPLSCWHQLHRLSCSTSVSYQDLLPALCFLTVSSSCTLCVCWHLGGLLIEVPSAPVPLTAFTYSLSFFWSLLVPHTQLLSFLPHSYQSSHFYYYYNLLLSLGDS